MKTPDEIKKALEICDEYYTQKGCAGCPYFVPSSDEPCQWELFPDVLAHIKQLEARIATLTAKAVLFDEAIAAGEKYKRERDAAINDMREASWCPCNVCKHHYRPDPNVRKYRCKVFGDFSTICNEEAHGYCGKFKWRGVKEDKPDENA